MAGLPEHLLRRSAEAKAKATGRPVEEILAEMKGEAPPPPSASTAEAAGAVRDISKESSELGVPEDLLQRSLAARAQISGVPVAVATSGAPQAAQTGSAPVAAGTPATASNSRLQAFNPHPRLTINSVFALGGHIVTRWQRRKSHRPQDPSLRPRCIEHIAPC